VINQNLSLDFSSDITSFSHTVTRLIYGIELTGESIDTFDWDVEEIQLNGRMVFTILVRVNESELQDFLFYVTDSNKKLTIDSYDYAVVNDPVNYKLTIKAWRKHAGISELKLRFKRRGLGVDLGDVLSRVLETQDGVLVETDDGLLIEIH